jgi:hypothetical protein
MNQSPDGIRNNATSNFDDDFAEMLTLLEQAMAFMDLF